MTTLEKIFFTLSATLLQVFLAGCSGTSTADNPQPVPPHAALVPDDSLIGVASIRLEQLLEKAGRGAEFKELLGVVHEPVVRKFLLEPTSTGIDLAQPVYLFLELDVSEDVIQKLVNNRVRTGPDWEPPDYPEDASPAVGASFALADVAKLEEWTAGESMTWEDRGEIRLLELSPGEAFLAHDGKSCLFVGAPKGTLFTSPETRFSKTTGKQSARPPYLQDLFAERDDVAVYAAGRWIYDTLNLVEGDNFSYLPILALMDTEALLQANASDGALNVGLKLDRGRYRDTFAPMPEERYTPEEVAEVFTSVIGTWKITSKQKPNDGEEREVDSNMTTYGYESGKSLIRHTVIETEGSFTLEEYDPRTGTFIGKTRPPRGPARLFVLSRDKETQAGRLLHASERHFRNPDDINSVFKRVDKDQFERKTIVSKDGKTIFTGTYLNRRTASGDPNPICAEDEFDPSLLELLDAKAILNVHLREDLAHTITTDNLLLEFFYLNVFINDRLNYQEFAANLGYTLPELVQTFTGQAVFSLHDLPDESSRNEFPSFTLAIATRPPAEKVRGHFLKKLLAKSLPFGEEDAPEPLIPPEFLTKLSISAKGNQLLICTKDMAEQVLSGKSENPLPQAQKAWFSEGNQRIKLNFSALVKAIKASTGNHDPNYLQPLNALSGLDLKHSHTGVLSGQTELNLTFTKQNANAIQQLIPILKAVDESL